MRNHGRNDGLERREGERLTLRECRGIRVLRDIHDVEVQRIQARSEEGCDAFGRS